jgi:divalent metal cation (Fe/Co/Zn/Cd) transporter
VQTHLEPLERTLAAAPTGDGDEASVEREVDQLVRERTGAGAHRVKLLSTDAGRVVFVTLGVPAGEALSDAHLLAGELEEELRLKIPDIVDVVIHTEP